MPYYFNESLSGVPYFFRTKRFLASKATAKSSFFKSMANGIFTTIQSNSREQRVFILRYMPAPAINIAFRTAVLLLQTTIFALLMRRFRAMFITLLLFIIL
jgi:glucose-6-phosphate 1-dehydrogenase